MSKRKTSAAIVGLLDDIKQAGLQTVSSDTMVTQSIKKPFTSQEAQLFNDSEITTSYSSQSEIDYVIKKLRTEQCRPWKMANRLNEYISPESCAELIESMRQVGQQIPILVRKSKEWSGYDVICGARRFFACNHLGIDVKAAIVELTDKEALLAMDAENRPRQDISPYERALDYKRWVDTGAYRNYAEIGEAIGVKKAWFSQLMALAEIDQTIIRAFKHPANLKLKWGYALYLLCKKDGALTKRMIDLALTLTHEDLSPEQVFRKLKSLVHQNGEILKNETVWVKDNRNKKLFGIKQDFYGRTQFVFNKSIPKELLDEVVHQVRDFIETVRANEV